MNAFCHLVISAMLMVSLAASASKPAMSLAATDYLPADSVLIERLLAEAKALPGGENRPLFFARKYALHRLLFLFELFAQSLRVQPLLPRLYLRHLRLALSRNLALGKQHAVDRQIDAAKLRLGDLGVRLLEHVADLRDAEVGRQLVVLALFLFVLPLLRLFRLLFGMLLVRDGLGDLFLHGRNVRLLGLFLFRYLVKCIKK